MFFLTNNIMNIFLEDIICRPDLVIAKININENASIMAIQCKSSIPVNRLNTIL